MEGEGRIKVKRPYAEIMHDVAKAPYGKERRELHRELKKYYHSGLPLFMRYPKVPSTCFIIYLVVSLILLAILTVLILLEFAKVLPPMIQLLTR